MSYKGRFKPKNREKYKGNPDGIVYRSLWELKFMRYLDRSDDCIWYASEEGFVPYVSPIDNKIHRYYPDVLVKFKTKAGEKIFLVEIKPKKKLLPPKPPKRKGRRFIRETMEYHVNQAKFKAATEFCVKKGWTFKILTEDDLGIK